MAIVPSDELGLVVLIEEPVFQEESLGLALDVSDKLSSFLEDQLDEVEAENVLGVAHLRSCDCAHLHLGAQVDRLVDQGLFGVGVVLRNRILHLVRELTRG